MIASPAMRHPDDITHNGKTLTEILRLHGMWLRGEEGGERANLSGADLSYADLIGVNLFGAILIDAILICAGLPSANLRHAVLSRANLSGANLMHADMNDLTLTNAIMIGANMVNADITHANLSQAIMVDANLTGADLFGAILIDADLSHADLLCYGNMRQIKTMQIEGWHIGYTHDALQIGCQRHPIETWRKWNTEDGREWIDRMDDTALAWADRFLGLVLQIIDASPAEK